MSRASENRGCDQSELVYVYALQALPAGDVPAVEAHIARCPGCRQELEAVRSTVDCFVAWPTDVLRPSGPLWERLAQRLAVETGEDPLPAAPAEWVEPEWDEVAPGISCKLLATDSDRDRVSMLVRLGQGVDYPPHRHAGVEELHLLDGELLVDDRKLYPGDYITAEPGTADARVWSETGCTCVLTTSIRDELH